jgi:hypothetical protein
MEHSSCLDSFLSAEILYLWEGCKSWCYGPHSTIFNAKLHTHEDGLNVLSRLAPRFISFVFFWIGILYTLLWKRRYHLFSNMLADVTWLLLWAAMVCWKGKAKVIDMVEIAGSGLETSVNDWKGGTKGMRWKRALQHLFTLSYFLCFYMYGSFLCYAKICVES